LPLAAKHAQHGARIIRQHPAFRSSTDSPYGIKVRYETRGDEGCAPAPELCVIDSAAPHHLVFNNPRQTAFRVFLYVARHVRVASPADGYVDRWAWMSHVSHGGTESHGFNQVLCLYGALYAKLRLATPHAVTIIFYLFRQRINHTLDCLLVCN